MTSAKDFVEGYVYSRRRLVAAFVSGRRGIDGEEFPRERRRVLGGLLLAGLLLAGVILAPMLVPDKKPASIDLTVSRSELPASDALVQSGWIACTADRAGVAVEVAASSYPRVVDRSSAVVRAEDGLWLIATPSGHTHGAGRYRLTEHELDGVDIGSTVPSVPVGWLALLPVMATLPGGGPTTNTAAPGASDEPAAAPTELCLELDVGPGRRPKVWLVDRPASEAGLPPAGEDHVAVEPGHGALVIAGNWTEVVDETPVLLDSFGVLHPLPEGPDALAAIGYRPDLLPAVPRTWLDLFTDGLTLTPTSQG